MAKVFILEDDPARMALFWKALDGHDVTAKSDVESAQRAYQGPYDIAFLDHDLGGETYVPSEHHNTGYAFAKWLQDRDHETPVIVHSMNHAGATRMVDRLGSRATWMPFFGPTFMKALGYVSQKEL